MPIIAPKNTNEKGSKPNKWANGEYGKYIVTSIVSKVAPSKYGLGRLLKTELRVRTMSTTKLADITDSRNQPVWNCASLECKSVSNTPNVR